MQGLFVSLYHFFTRRKPLFWFVFIATFAAWVFFSLRIRPKEDISSMLPDSKAIRAMNNVISHTQAGEQVVFLLSFKDTSATDPDSLILAADNLQEGINKQFDQWI